jgi:protein disulfide-isomerase
MHAASAPLPSSSNSEVPPDRKRLLHFGRFFWLVFLVVSLAFVWYCFYVPTHNTAWADSYAAAQEQATDSGKPIILYFTGGGVFHAG